MERKFKNQILNSLDAATIARLELQPVDLPVGREIEFPGNSIRHLFFLEEGISSMTATFEDGFQVEVALAGCESVLGASSMVGTTLSLNRVYMQIAGHGYSSRTETAFREFKRGEMFQDLTLRSLQAQFIQAAQTAGCNAHHPVEERLARWLLLCAERHGKRVLPLTHEYLANMLGSRRATVTIASGHLQAKKLIQYTRGRITILDLPGLEAAACECYRTVRNHMDYAQQAHGRSEFQGSQD